MNELQKNILTAVCTALVGIGGFWFLNMKTTGEELAILRTKVATLETEKTNSELAGIKADIAGLKADVSNIKIQLSEIRQDIRELKHFRTTVEKVGLFKPDKKIDDDMKK